MSKPKFRIIEQEAGAVDYSDYEEFKQYYLQEPCKNIASICHELGVSSKRCSKYIRRIKVEEGFKRISTGAGTWVVPLDYKRGDGEYGG